MTQIEDLQARLTRALDRIGQGLEAYEPGGGVDVAEMDALRAQLSTAETALAEAQERSAALAEQTAAEISAAVGAARAEAEAGREAAIEAAVDAAVEAARAEASRERDAVVAAIRAEAALASAEGAAPVVAEAEAGPVEDVEALREALEDERMANAQLEERLRALKAKQAEAPAETPAPAPGLAALDAELGRLRKANAALVESIAALREANAQGVGDPHLINTAMLTELDALRAARATDAAEIGAVMEGLEPLLVQAAAENGEAH